MDNIFYTPSASRLIANQSYIMRADSSVCEGQSYIYVQSYFVRMCEVQILEHCQSSFTYQSPNFWTSSVSWLKIFALPNLKMNLKVLLLYVYCA